MDIATFRDLVWSQLGAAIEALENAIAQCPDELWSDQSRKPGYWFLACHALLLHLYNMRHVQHHAAQLNLILRQVLDKGSPWVFKAKDAT